MPSLPDSGKPSCLHDLARSGLLTPREVSAVVGLLDPNARLSSTVGLAETIHLHIKVDDTLALPVNAFFDAGARLDHQREGFVKYRFPEGVNAIFSHIKVSQDELLETDANRRPRPFLDHIGVDLRDETATVRKAFDALPALAGELAWAHTSQGGTGRPVYCCHVEVAEKHWLYPRDGDVHAGIPLEFAYGALKVNPGKMGCDLRPADPRKVDPAFIPCCATACDPHPTASEGPVAPNLGYYQPSDLKRFAEITRVNPKLGNAFFSYYQQVMGDGVLSKREKALTALAVAHALKCPYCIDAYTDTLHEMGAGEDEMSEVVHVASAMVAGITLVHSVQMMNKLDQLNADKRGTRPCC